MKVILPNVASHTILIIPRFYPSGSIKVFISGVEASGVSYSSVNGNMYVTFSKTFQDREKAEIKITEGDDVVYRGDLFATSQTPQDYRKTNSQYTYQNE